MNVEIILGAAVTLLMALRRSAPLQAVIGERVAAWSAKLPRWLQPIPPLALALALSAAYEYTQGLRGEELLLAVLASGGEATAWAISLWHVGKRVFAGKSSPIPPAATAVVAMITGIALSSCAALSRIVADDRLKSCVAVIVDDVIRELCSTDPSVTREDLEQELLEQIAREAEREAARREKESD